MRSQLIVWQGNDGILYFPLLGFSKQSWLSLSRQGGPCVLGVCPGTRAVEFYMVGDYHLRGSVSNIQVGCWYIERRMIKSLLKLLRPVRFWPTRIEHNASSSSALQDL